VAAVATLGTAGVSGTELNLYELTHSLERTNRTADDRERAIALQRSIQQAVLTGTGWDQIPVNAQVRQQADTPYFQSMLRHDPSKIVKDVKQPILIVQGERDRVIPPTSADLLEAMAKQRKRGTVETLKAPELNHLLVPATTGEPDEYGALRDRTIHTSVTTRLADWLRRSFAAIR
jgi:pimeloyl-ACP methyl ester carboxylesterase